MSLNNYEQYLFPIIILFFWGYRFYRFKKIKKMLPKLLKEGALLIDVRTKNEFLSGYNPMSINIPLDQIHSESKNLDHKKTIILCCASGTRSSLAVGIFKKNGFPNVLNAGPWKNTLIK